MTQVLNMDGHLDEVDQVVVDHVSEVLRNGGLAVVPTDTSYALIADAFDAEAVSALRAIKGYEVTVPIPVGTASLEMAAGVAQISHLARDLVAAFWPGPLTILTAAQPSLAWTVGRRDVSLALRMPAHRTLQAIIQSVGPIAMTGVASPVQEHSTTIATVQARYGQAVGVYLDAGSLECVQSTIVDCTGSNLRLLRTGEISLFQLREVMPMIIDATAST